MLDTVNEYRLGDAASSRRWANLEVWYAHLEIESTLQKFSGQLKAKQVKAAEKQVAKARTRDSHAAFSKLTELVDGKARIVDQSPLIVPITKLAADEAADEIFEELRPPHSRLPGSSLQSDRRVLLEAFELQDFARKVVGVGSVGTRAWIALLMGRDSSDPLFLQIKEAEASVLEPFLGPSEYANHGERVVTGQRLMQAASDIFLGWLHVDAGIDGVSRATSTCASSRTGRRSAAIEEMTPRGMATYGRLCGWTLARAHARSGDRIAIASYLGAGDTFDRAMLEFSKAYAERNERDYNALADAVKSGRIAAETGL